MCWFLFFSCWRGPSRQIHSQTAISLVFLKSRHVLPDMVDGCTIVTFYPWTLCLVSQCHAVAPERARRLWKGRERRGDKQGGKGWNDNHVLRHLFLFFFCLMTSLPLRNRVLASKTLMIPSFLPLFFFPSWSTWHITLALGDPPYFICFGLTNSNWFGWLRSSCAAQYVCCGLSYCSQISVDP